jgi:hypothetical protein
MREAFPTKCIWYKNVCNLRYKDAYTSCYICHAKCKKCTKKSYTYTTKELEHAKLTNHRLLGGKQKGLDTTGKRAKERKTHKLPLNTCTRAKEHTKLTLSTHDREKIILSTHAPLNSCIKFKEHTKLTLHTWDRARSKTNQVAWPRPHTWRSQIYSPWSFLHNSLILVHHPQKWCTSMSPPGYEAGEPPPISTKCSPGLPPATQNQEQERANDSTLGLVPKVSNQCRAIFSKVGLATSILPRLSKLRSIMSNLSNLEPPRENHSRLIGGVRLPR